METKDTVRERRQMRIRELMNEDKPAETTIARPVTHVFRESLPSAGDNRVEADPEMLWKSQPNPWMGWTGGVQASNGSETPPPNERRPGQLAKEFRLKLLLSLVLFGCGWGLFQLDMPWARSGQALVGTMLTADMDFSAAAAWYERTFAGSPAFIPIFGDREPTAERAQAGIRSAALAPVSTGVIVRNFAEMTSGVEIATVSGAEVRAIETGRVLILSSNSVQGETLILQHANQRLSVYGRLDRVHVAQHDWVEAGDVIGRLKPAADGGQSQLYFAVRDRDRYVNPADVITLD